jgi:hypothetical protein
MNKNRAIREEDVHPCHRERGRSLGARPCGDVSCDNVEGNNNGMCGAGTPIHCCGGSIASWGPSLGLQPRCGMTRRTKTCPS